MDEKLKVMDKAGATREKSWVAVAEGLTATKMTLDKYGEEHVEADHTTRLRSAELIARATGDIKSDGVINNNTQVVIACTKEEMLGFVNEIARLTGKSDRYEQSGEIIDIERDN